MSSLLARSFAAFSFAVLLCSTASGSGAEKYFAIEVFDEETGRGVPLVELTTVHGVRYVTDSVGKVAFYEPGLMNENVFFSVSAHGYERAKDGFGYPSAVARTTPGETHRIAVRRTNIAERLYRLSGEGIYRDTVLLGLEPPAKEPLLNAKVMGKDSVVAAAYNGKIYWFWGDTLRPGYPLGNYDASGATSPLPGPGGTVPDRSIEYSYFTDDTGFAKKMAPMPGDGPTWLAGVTTVADDEGRERLVTGYAKIRNLLHAYVRGVAVFDDEKEEFVNAAAYPVAETPLYPTGHALKGEEDGTSYVYFTWSLPLVRVPAVLDDIKHFDRYETFTPLRANSRWEDRDVERDAGGRVIYGWKTGTRTVGPSEQATLIEEGLLSNEEALFAPRDVVSGKSIRLHSGAVEWNPFRERWVLIVSELFGTSALGEVWFAEADSPLGPWVYARKIISHDGYSFYNPKHHRFLDEEDGRIIYVEGTYTEMFSGAAERTPRYDYNQILYRLDLASPELTLPVAIYRDAAGGARCLLSARQGAEGGTRPEFWALEEPVEGATPVWCREKVGGECRLVAGAAGPEFGGNPVALFYGLPADTEDPPPGTVPLRREGGEGEVVCYVWEHPMPAGPVLPIRVEGKR